MRVFKNCVFWGLCALLHILGVYPPPQLEFLCFGSLTVQALTIQSRHTSTVSTT